MTFTLLQERDIPEINSKAKLYVHEQTGARLISVTNSDENKAFGITFRTPPASSNGIAHIMEHSVLCGSRKYPAKEPFIELAKSSLNTFLNAMTYPDKTTYPVASTNLKDFYNLIDVYLDAVFYPLIPERTLQQEGWHYEIESPDAPLTFKGVVFNEMKGNYSSPDSLLNEHSQHSIYPDMLYSLDSGGDPLVIPDLTYAEFKHFHQTYYHPSNAYIWFYGDDPEEERFRILEDWLKDFEKQDPKSEIPLQPRFSAPRREVHKYDSGETDDPKSYINLNWMLDEIPESETSLGLAILSHILTGTPASPLRKALMDSGLGEDLTGGGMDSDFRQMKYSVGMKGVLAENTAKVEELILETLTQLTSGIDADTIAASVNTVEFHLREQNTGRFPRGLSLMLGALTAWIYDRDPLEELAFEAPLSAVKARIAKGEKYFEGLIQKYLLDNPHRSTVVLEPDPNVNKQRDEIEKERLAKTRAAMSQADLEKVMADLAALKHHQETPDTPEALASIPSLSLNDLDKQAKTVPIEVSKAGGAQVLYHDLFTNGIAYLDLGFDLHSVPQDLLPYVGLFGRALLELGTEKEDFVKLTQRIGRSTGGVWSSTITTTERESDKSVLWFMLRGKAVVSQTPELFAILKDVLLTAQLDNPERFKQIVLEEKAGTEAGLIPGGHGVVHGRLSARFSEAAWVSEQIGGLDQLFFLRGLAEQMDKDWAGVLAKLEALRKVLINRSAMLVNVTLDEANWKRIQPQVADFVQALPSAPFTPQRWDRQPVTINEGLTIPAQVNYVGKGANLYAQGYEPDGSIHVIRNYLGTTWLWDKIRVQGGAYGGFSTFDQNSGTFDYLSYRDPNVLATLDNYDNTVKFLRDLDLSDSELTKAIIGTIGDFDAYLLPDAKGYQSMLRHLTNYTDEARQRTRDEVLGTTTQDFKQFAEVLQRVAEHGEVVVLGSAEAINKANAEKGQFLEVKKVL
ncbi:MAG: insulinase family protein [Chloroflexi bacterium]|nr:insulinase family protein [Chloroflexota bacterium]